MAVAYSGGRDSTALLHATARVARDLRIEVVGLHVHHGLMREADAWLEHAENQVRRWRKAGLPVRLSSTRLQGKPAKGESVEAWARRERRAALARMAREHGVDTILTAHHRRDQAETVLLQALRGAGPAGLAAMPRVAQRDGLWWLRPWLDTPREAIEAYVQGHELRFVDDASNVDSRFARGRVRKTVWRALTQAFGDAEVALAAVARRAHEAHALLIEVAVSDLAAVVDDAGRLQVAAWRALSAARRANALRAWLHAGLDRGAPESLVERLSVELPKASAARWPLDSDRELALYRGRLAFAAVPPLRNDNPVDAVIDLSRAGVHALPHWHGALEVTRVARDGVPAALLKSCRLAARRGGEQWQAQPCSMPRSLKKQFQAAGIPPSQRAGPLLFAQGQLVFVPGLGLDARVRAGPNNRRVLLALRWRPAEPQVSAKGLHPSG
ncbi:MAG TPA: tRNA lysidine(34) synthetase TilS [Burkholderiaceae bacterium]|nr:tRNA lysidine(34) synthetase TilS [Burkholderiaceae bacterium]